MAIRRVRILYERNLFRHFEISIYTEPTTFPPLLKKSWPALLTSVRCTQKSSFSANWINRGLLLVAVIRPKSPGLMIRPVLELMLPPDEKTALRLLIGLARLT